MSGLERINEQIEECKKIIKYLNYDVYNQELIIFKSTKKEDYGRNYYVGYLPIYKNLSSYLMVYYALPNTKQKLFCYYSPIEIKNLGFSTLQEHFLKKLNLEPKNISIEKIIIGEKTYNDLLKIAEVNDKVPLHKRIKTTLKDILNWSSKYA